MLKYKYHSICKNVCSCTQKVMVENECPSILPPRITTNSYRLHVNLPSDQRPPLILRASSLGPLKQFFNQSQFECVVCTGDCVSEEDIIFRLQASTIETGIGFGISIKCLGDTVSSSMTHRSHCCYNL